MLSMLGCEYGGGIFVNAVGICISPDTKHDHEILTLDHSLFASEIAIATFALLVTVLKAPDNKLLRTTCSRYWAAYPEPHYPGTTTAHPVQPVPVVTTNWTYEAL
jgi:hypothetical protein